MARAARIGGRWCAAAVAAVYLAFSPGAIAQSTRATVPSALQDLAGIGELHSLFDRDSDKIRVVMLLSPT